MAEQLEIAETREGEAEILKVTGELDIATSRRLEERLRALVAQHGQVVLDLSELSFIDSSGLAVLINAARASANDGGGLGVRAVSDAVWRVLELSGVAGELKLLPDLRR